MQKTFKKIVGRWIETYKEDIKSKLSKFLADNESSVEELADVIDVDVDELYAIMDGEGEIICVETLIKVMMTLGFAIGVMPIEQSPLGSYDAPHDDHQMPMPPMHGGRTSMTMPPMHAPHRDFTPHRDVLDMPMPPRPNPFTRERMGAPTEAPIPMYGTRKNPPIPPTHTPTPSEEYFEGMDRARLTRIIKSKLWDSEIDLVNSSTKELKDFLIGKRNHAMRRAEEKRRSEEVERSRERELDNDPKVMDFIARLKTAAKENPNFKKYIKDIVGNIGV